MTTLQARARNPWARGLFVLASLVAALLTLGGLRVVTWILAYRLGVEIHFLGTDKMAGFITFAVVLGFIGALWSVASILRRTA